MNVFTGRFMIWGRTQAPTAGGRKEGSLCGCLSCYKSMLARGSLSFDGAELGRLEVAHPVLRSCPRTGLLPIGMLLIGNRWLWKAGLQDLEGWWAHLHSQVQSHTHCHTSRYTHLNRHMHTNTDTHLQHASARTVTQNSLTNTHSFTKS